MDKQQAKQYKANYIDNKSLEFICKHGKEPSAKTITSWGKEADEKLREMIANLQKWMQ